MMDFLSDLGPAMPVAIGLAALVTMGGAAYGLHKYKEFRDYRTLRKCIYGWWDDERGQ